jgi:hypothetical protein
MIQSHRYNLIAGLLVLMVVALLLWAMTAWAGDAVTYHLTKSLPASDDAPKSIRVIDNHNKVVLEAQWREVGVEREPGYELWERMTGFFHRGEAHTLLMTWPLCVGANRCAEINKTQLEKALGRNLEQQPVQTNTPTVTWK